ncbi:hypothetical protein HRI_001908600 [Hibiscus trionum]|uniref:RNase H type-1 domain-containing protein n=1 Tax=Hibiscus trionum TaxID=183268 RepID=A0A9W7HRW6_HIBTR|nr:hypothetical protein HRI_001908600 [Hibiscus trionum]
MMLAFCNIFRCHRLIQNPVRLLRGWRATSIIAELPALRRGLELVLENGWTDLWLEGDAKTLIDIIVRGRQVKCAEPQRCVSHISSIIPDLNNCVVTHIYRQGNRAAHKFAQIGHQLDKPRIWWHIPPNEVECIVDEDAEGKIILRRR